MWTCVSHDLQCVGDIKKHVEQNAHHHVETLRMNNSKVWCLWPYSSHCKNKMVHSISTTVKFHDASGLVVFWAKGEKESSSCYWQVVVHYYARLAAKQGWRFDSTYEHKDDTGDAVPFEFVVGSSEVCNHNNMLASIHFDMSSISI